MICIFIVLLLINNSLLHYLDRSRVADPTLLHILLKISINFSNLSIQLLLSVATYFLHLLKLINEIFLIFYCCFKFVYALWFGVHEQYYIDGAISNLIQHWVTANKVTFFKLNEAVLATLIYLAMKYFLYISYAVSKWFKHVVYLLTS